MKVSAVCVCALYKYIHTHIYLYCCDIHTHTHTHIHRERETKRETERETPYCKLDQLLSEWFFKRVLARPVHDLIMRVFQGKSNTYSLTDVHGSSAISRRSLRAGFTSEEMIYSFRWWRDIADWHRFTRTLDLRDWIYSIICGHPKSLVRLALESMHSMWYQ